MRIRTALTASAAIAIALSVAVGHAGDDNKDEKPVPGTKKFQHSVKKMGSNINRSLGLGKKRIGKSKHPYSSRSFSSRGQSRARNSTLRELYEQNLLRHEKEAAMTNQSPTTATSPADAEAQ